VAVLGAFAVIALVGAALALRLDPSASTDTLVDKGSPAFKATEDFRQEFGEEPVVVLVKGELQQTILTPDLGVLLRLEGCLSGNVPKEGLRTLPEVCTWFAAAQPAKVVYGPGTFVNTAASQIAEGFSAKQAAKAREAGRPRKPRAGCPSGAATRPPSSNASPSRHVRSSTRSSPRRRSGSRCATG
jgi:hypothetical protein